jgi:ATP-dependent RNA helicase HelY
VLSTIVYEARREEGPPAARHPGGSDVAAALQATVAQWSVLRDQEEAHRLPGTAEPDLGLVWPLHRWCRGQKLEDVLDAGPADLAAGDFVRWCRQLLDLLDQVVVVAATAGDERLARTARSAIALVDRGVVAYSVGSTPASA